jgi:hypothetical protein
VDARHKAGMTSEIKGARFHWLRFDSESPPKAGVSKDGPQRDRRQFFFNCDSPVIGDRYALEYFLSSSRAIWLR